MVESLRASAGGVARKPSLVDRRRGEDVDEAFFNGVKIGANGAMPPLYGKSASSVRRPFVIEPDWVRFGDDNLVAWRIYNKAGQARIAKGPIHLTRKDDAIDLGGRWLFKAGDSPEWSQWHSGPEPSGAAAEAESFRQQAGATFAGHKGVVRADKEHREEMIAQGIQEVRGQSQSIRSQWTTKEHLLMRRPPGETFEVGDGLAVDTVLKEPVVRQPLYVDFDERGRLWVVQLHSVS